MQIVAFFHLDCPEQIPARVIVVTVTGDAYIGTLDRHRIPVVLRDAAGHLIPAPADWRKHLHNRRKPWLTDDSE